MARVRKHIDEAKTAAEKNDSKELYAALRADLLDKVSGFSDAKEYLQCMMIIMKLQGMIDKSGVSLDEDEENANNTIQEAREKIAKLEASYEEFMDDFSEEAFDDRD